MGSAGTQTQVSATPYPDEALSLSNKKDFSRSELLKLSCAY